MNCSEARRLLDQGITPGSYAAERAALGFHLAGCPACRAYRASLQDRLLNDLLFQQTAPPAPPAPPEAPPSVPDVPPRRAGLSPGRVLWLGALGVLGSIVLVVLITLGSLLLSLFHIHQNVQAMIVPTLVPPTFAPTLVPTLVPTLAPTLTPQPSATAAPPSATPPPTLTPTPTRPPATATPAPPAAGGPITVLLLGSDRRPDETGPARTDAIIIARIDPQAHRVALLSLPRDLWVEVPGYGSTRINAVHVWGETYGEPGGGMALARAAVSNLLGIPIDYAVYVDFEGFIGAIDALGGITVSVEKELYDSRFPTMDYGYSEVHFLPGPQVMDGAAALTYSRIRHPDSDFARMWRQQAVLAGIMARLHEQNLLQNITSIEQITTALRDYVKTDIPAERVIGLLWALRDFTPDQIEQYRLGPEMVSFGVGDDRWAEVALPGTIENLVRHLIGAASP